MPLPGFPGKYEQIAAVLGAGEPPANPFPPATPRESAPPSPEPRGGLGGFVGGALDMLGNAAQRLPAAYAAGQGDLALAAQLQAGVDAQQRQAAMVRDLNGLDPTQPGDVGKIVNVLMRYGDTDSVMQYLQMVQNGYFEELKAYQQRVAVLAEMHAKNAEAALKAEPKLEDALKLRESYAKKDGAQGAGYETMMDALAKIEAAGDSMLDPNVSEGARAQAWQVVAVAFQKLLDPDSVVRESEYGRSIEFQSAVARLNTEWEKFKTGGVPPELVFGVADQARILGRRASENQIHKYEAAISDIGAWGLDSARVLSPFRDPRRELERLNARIQAGSQRPAPAPRPTAAPVPAQSPDDPYEYLELPDGTRMRRRKQ